MTSADLPDPQIYPLSDGLGCGPASAAKSFRISAIESVIVDAPTIRRHKMSTTEIAHQSLVIVRLRLDGGAEGFGEAATLGGPRWAEESVESIKAAIDHYLAPVVIGEDARTFEALAVRLTAAATRNHAAKAAIESALYDAVGKTFGLSASYLIGGPLRERMEVLWALASGDADQEIEEAREKLEWREHRRFKIKIGFRSPEEDLRRLRRIAEAIGERAELIVDVNQGWSEAKAIRWLPALSELGVTLVEQPLPAGQVEALVRVARRSPIPIMVDEAAFGLTEVARVGALGAGSVLSLKLVKSGGWQEMKRAAAVAQAHGLELYGGCLLESGIGAAAHLSVFATLPSLEWGVEHFGPRILLRDLTRSGLVYSDFHVLRPQGPGLGVEIDQDALKDLSRRA